MHHLTDIDRPNRTAICSVDGVVPIVSFGKYYRCAIKRREWERNRYKVNPEHPNRPTECEVCGSTKRICFDHDHATGLHRGWLCDACNRALGYVKDNPKTLRKLAYYLEKQ